MQLIPLQEASRPLYLVRGYCNGFERVNYPERASRWWKDLRRTDFEICWECPFREDWHALQGGTIKRSLNLPAQSLYPAIPTLYYCYWLARPNMLFGIAVSFWSVNQRKKYYPFLTIFRISKWSWNACCGLVRGLHCGARGSIHEKPRTRRWN